MYAQSVSVRTVHGTVGLDLRTMTTRSVARAEASPWVVRVVDSSPAKGMRRRGTALAFTVIAHYTARAGESEAVRAALRRMVEPTRAEPGCLRYEVYVDPHDADLVMLVESYVDAPAFQAHLETPHFERHLRNDVLPRLAQRTRFDLVPLDELAS